MGLIMEVTTEIFTISELAKICGCSKQTIDKHINNKGLVNTLTNRNGKQVKAYNLTSTQLQEFKNLVAINKGMVMQSTSDNQPINNDYLDKYIEIKALYEAANAQNKLLEDRQGGLLQENKELNAQLQDKCSEIGGLKSAIQAKEQENERLQQAQKSYKRVITGLLLVLTVILMAVVIKVLTI